MRHVPSSLVISAVVAGALLVHLCIGSLSGPRCKMRISLWSCYYCTERVKCKTSRKFKYIVVFYAFYLKSAGYMHLLVRRTFASTFYLFCLHDEVVS
jgi:hypothetical protein